MATLMLALSGSSPPPAVAAEGSYRTPRAGEEVDAIFLGRPVHVEARDLRRVYAATVGMASTIPNTGGIPVIPFGAVFVFYRPDEDRFVEAVIAGIQNNVLSTWSPRSWGSFEVIGTFRSTTIPAARSEIIRGRQLDAIEVEYGAVQGGAGFGYRKQVGATAENMLVANFIVEPGFRYYARGADTSPAFVLPPNTFELLLRALFRYDGFERNLISLIHSGVGFGAEAVFGYRSKTANWGIDALQDGRAAGRFGRVSGYIQAASGLPFIDSERHRLIGVTHFGVGFDTDRFSATRVGGGPDSDQYRTIRSPLIPGATFGEFYPSDYVVMMAEYRYELTFFSYIGLLGSVSNIDANAEMLPFPTGGRSWLSSIGFRVTTGFLFQTRVRIDYNYNFDIIRNGSPGGNEVVLNISREF